MIRTVSAAELGGFESPGIVVRDHFRKVPENRNGPHYRLGPLCTLADIAIQPGSGFPIHGHRDMEIVTYVCAGELSHQDRLGNRGCLGPGDVQAITAGTGIEHSERNQGGVELRLYQFWIEPWAVGIAPSSIDVRRPKAAAPGRLGILASGADGYAAAAELRADVAILGADLVTGAAVEHPLTPDRQSYVVVARGRVLLNGTELGDGAGAEPGVVDRLVIEALADSEVLVLNLPR